MNQRRHSARLLAAAITMLLTGSLVSAFGLVLCLGADGHRAVEREHYATGCPTLASVQGATDGSVRRQVECIDVASAGIGPMVLPDVDAERVPTPAVAFMFPIQKPAPQIEMRLSASTDARAGPPGLAVHLRSTVLLV